MMKTILTEQDIKTLESYDDGYYYKMLEYLQQAIDIGVRDQKFTVEDAEHDLLLTLWIAYACNNIDEYETYYMSCQWLSGTENLAQGCGVWYYRYSCALMYCGKLTEAHSYAEQGVLEDPDYPWGWLQLAKLRAHFGDREGALSANKQGLSLAPGNYEFIRQEKELLEGASLEQLLYHYIEPEDDLSLADDTPDAAAKRRIISYVVCDKKNLRTLKSLLRAETWIADAPYCTCKIPYQNGTIRISFQMNEAAASKLSAEWLTETLRTLPQLENLQRPDPNAELDQLTIHIDQSLSLGFRRKAASKKATEIPLVGTNPSVHLS